MILAATVEHLRDYCPMFGRRVAGAADFQRGLVAYNANLGLPAAYVVPLDQQSEGHEQMIGLRQTVSKTIAVIVELDTRDRRGQAAAMEFDEIEATLWHALLNWHPLPWCRTANQQGFYFSGARMLGGEGMDRARLFYQWEFGLSYQLDDDDGWKWPAEPLRAIKVKMWKAPPWNVPREDETPTVIKVITNEDEEVEP